jgi:hypothetical protein
MRASTETAELSHMVLLSPRALLFYPSPKSATAFTISLELVESSCSGHKCVPSPLVGEG